MTNAGTKAHKPPAIFLMGPTASGKTGAAMAMADQLPVQLINVDSAQIYRGMDIGTAKPGKELRARYPHRLMDILDPAERFSAAQFRTDALREMAVMTAAGKVPLLVGGTGLYFRALERGLAELPPADPQTRTAIETEAARRGWPALHAELAAVDPDSAARISPNDPQRIQRALEVFRLTGKPLGEHWQSGPDVLFPYRALKLALAPDRATLHNRIEQRFHDMMAAGFLDEVKALRSRGDLAANMPSMRAVGYRQLWEYLEGEGELEDAVRRGIVASRRYAKRQMTWFRSEPGVLWFDPADQEVEKQLVAAAKSFLAGE